jgi:hypothetical protein
MSELTNNDYKVILEYYNKQIPKSNRLLKKRAEQILANKLCKCIKKVEPTNEARSIGICTKSILNNKGYTRGKFKCKGKRAITLKKYKK